MVLRSNYPFETGGGKKNLIASPTKERVACNMDYTSSLKKVGDI